MFISEGVERSGKRIVAQFLFNQDRQALGLLAEINRCPVQINLWQRQGRA
jgi:hypothetical protein